jgi:hypothetical protein
MWEQVSAALNESAARMMLAIIRLLPGFVALLVSMLVALFLAMVIRLAMRRMLHGIRFDDRLTEWGVADVPELGPANRPTEWVVKALFWIILFAGFLIGLAAFDSALSSRLTFGLVTYVPAVVTAVLIIVVGKIVARYLERSVLIGAVNMNISSARPLSLAVKWMVLITTAAMALDYLGIGRGIVFLAFGILFGGIVLCGALAVGLGAKDRVRAALEQHARNTDHETTFHHL